MMLFQKSLKFQENLESSSKENTEFVLKLACSE